MRGMLGQIWTALRACFRGRASAAQNDVEKRNEPSCGVIDQVVTGGSGNLQVGVAYGNVVSNVCHNTHVTVIQAQPDASLMPSSMEQSAVLRKMDQLRDRLSVLEFMDVQFGTRMVIHLRTDQLFRLSRYLDVILRDPRNVRRPRKKPEVAQGTR